MSRIASVVEKMLLYFDGDVKRINHALKVYSFAKTIGELEGLSAEEQKILELAAVLHDIGIKVSEEKYGSSAGNYQEQEGPPIAKVMLEELGYDEKTIERVCFLIGHHHTYRAVDGKDFHILVESDFLVNIHEDEMSKESIKKVQQKCFTTQTGNKFLNSMFLKK